MWFEILLLWGTEIWNAFCQSSEFNGAYYPWKVPAFAVSLETKNKSIVIRVSILVPIHAGVSTARKTCGIENSVRVGHLIANGVHIILSLELHFKSSHTVIRNLLCMCFGN